MLEKYKRVIAYMLIAFIFVYILQYISAINNHENYHNSVNSNVYVRNKDDIEEDKFNSENSVSRMILQDQTKLSKCEYSVDNLIDDQNKVDDTAYDFEVIESNFKRQNIKIEHGGISLSSRNHNCSSKINVAIIIPYRDRMKHLKIFLNNMHPFLTRQKINYGIYIVDQFGNGEFNRGFLLNIGFIEAISDQKNNYPFVNWDCFIFHDVDFIPRNKRNLYKCNPKYPMHMSSSTEQHDEIRNWVAEKYWGGVYAVSKKQFINLNGHSNVFFGWGGEDDNFYDRVLFRYNYFGKLPNKIGRYHTPYSNHTRDKGNKNQVLKWYFRKRFRYTNATDGLTTIEYKLLRTKKTKYYTRFIVSFEKEDFIKYDNIDVKILNRNFTKKELEKPWELV